MTRERVSWAEWGGSLADSSGKCYNFITAINSGGKRGDKLSRRNETIGGHKLCARKWHIKCGVYVGADAYNANVGRQWSWQQLIATSTSAHTRLVLVTALHATSYKLHATCRTRPEPRPLLYCLHDTRTWTTTASTQLFSTISCSLSDSIVFPRLGLRRMKNTHIIWLRKSSFTFSSEFEYIIGFHNLSHYTIHFGNRRSSKICLSAVLTVEMHCSFLGHNMSHKML